MLRDNLRPSSTATKPLASPPKPGRTASGAGGQGTSDEITLKSGGVTHYIPPEREGTEMTGMEACEQTSRTDEQHSQAQRRAMAWLARANVRPTRQRVALSALLIGDGQHRHFTVENLFTAAKVAGERVSLATVYNTVKAFCEAGLVQEVMVDGAKSFFDTNTHDHPHFYWEDDGRLTDAPADELDIRHLPHTPEGAEVTSVDVVIRLRRRAETASH